MGQKNTIEVKHVSIEFPGVKALDDVSVTFESGKVSALIGANGAGKSTLMKVLSGANPTYTGDICYNGNPVEIRKPKDANDLKISIVYQEVDSILIPNLSVAENIMIDYLIYGLKNAGVINWKYIRSEAKKILDELHIDINVNSLISDLTLAQKQMVVIGQAMIRKCNFLILDEPTAPLSDKETQTLFELVRDLKKKGCGIIFISHRLNELFEICDDITVMRNGKIVGSRAVDDTLKISDIVSMMLGKVANEKVNKTSVISDEVLLEAKDFGNDTSKVHDINMVLHKGEIVGIAGLVGAGKTELCKSLFGCYGKCKGNLTINGKATSFTMPSQAIRGGMAMIPEERRKEGLVLDETVNHNLSIVTINKYSGFLGFVNRMKEANAAKKKVNDLLIKTPSINQKVGLLSGGNQQKVIIGKWIDSNADIYVFDEPTKGIDVGAKAEIYNLIADLAAQGKGVIYSSSEQDEIMKLSDRIYVMYNFTIQKELDPKKTSSEEIMFYSTGGSKK